MGDWSVEEALILWVSCALFLVWHAVSWIVERGRWHNSSFRNVEQPPIFMGHISEVIARFLYGIGILLIHLTPLILGTAALSLILKYITSPIHQELGEWHAIFATVTVFGTYCAASICVLIKMRKVIDEKNLSIVIEWNSKRGRKNDE